MSKQNPTRSRDNNILLGVIVMIIGFGLLLRKIDFILFPHWLFSWEVLVIIIGVLVGVRKQFQGVGWLIIVLVGSFFLIDELPGMYWIRQYSLPLGIIIIGIFLVFRSALTRSSQASTNQPYNRAGDAAGASTDEKAPHTGGDDYLNLTTVFGNIEKRVLSKDFRGGQSTVIFGGTELDFTNADINGVVVLDMVQVFGGVEIKVPANWDIKSEMTAIFGGIEDKRSTTSINADKQLVLKGTCLFGGVEIRSY